MSRVRAATAQGATFVELFFDLVFVYAVTQLTSLVLHDLSWEGVGEAALLFWLVWWAWTQFTWTLNLADTEHVWVRLPTLAATAVAFFLAQSVPDAFGDAGAWFAVSYVVVRLIGLGVQAWVIGSDQLESLVRWASLSLVGIALVLPAAFVSPRYLSS
jgi:low temperature requirement protein LtrA